MAVSGIEVASAAMMGLGLLMNIICVALPSWKRNDPQDTVLDNIFRVSFKSSFKSIEWLYCTNYEKEIKLWKYDFSLLQVLLTFIFDKTIGLFYFSSSTKVCGSNVKHSQQEIGIAMISIGSSSGFQLTYKQVKIMFMVNVGLSHIGKTGFLELK